MINSQIYLISFSLLFCVFPFTLQENCIIKEISPEYGIKLTIYNNQEYCFYFDIKSLKTSTESILTFVR